MTNVESGQDLSIDDSGHELNIDNTVEEFLEGLGNTGVNYHLRCAAEYYAKGMYEEAKVFVDAARRLADEMLDHEHTVRVPLPDQKGLSEPE